jgi:hypothetical protein
MNAVQRYKLLLGPNSFLSKRDKRNPPMLRSWLLFSSQSLFRETVARVNERIKFMMLANEYRLLLPAAILLPV